MAALNLQLQAVADWTAPRARVLRVLAVAAALAILLLRRYRTPTLVLWLTVAVLGGVAAVQLLATRPSPAGWTGLYQEACPGNWPGTGGGRWPDPRRRPELHGAGGDAAGQRPDRDTEGEVDEGSGDRRRPDADRERHQGGDGRDQNHDPGEEPPGPRDVALRGPSPNRELRQPPTASLATNELPAPEWPAMRCRAEWVVRGG